jgi:tetratricopeptide (TPR) repeat protein
MTDTTNMPNKSDQRWFLTDQREFLQRSLRDADAELAAGDLSPEDHAVLTGRDRKLLEEVTAELVALGVEADDLIDEGIEEPDDGPTRADWRRIGIIAACFLIVAGIVILVDHALSPRLPGQATSGSITLPKAQLIEQQLAQAASLSNSGQAVSALKLYNRVLSEDPNDPNALAGSGWLEWNYGTAAHDPTLESKGLKAEQKATKVAPTLFAGHFFLGLILFEQYDNYKGAVAQFNDFLAEKPPASEVKSVASLIRGAYTQAGVPVPAALAG